MPLLVECRITHFFSCNPPIARKTVGVTFDDFVEWQHIRQTCLCIETVETVLGTQRHRLDADTFLMFSVGWTCKRFVVICILAGLSSGLSP